jgi:signal peptidase I
MVSDSMAPAFRSGDCVVLLPSNKPLIAGTVIGFQVSDQFIIHRIISISKRGITTQGDQNKTPDPWLIPYSADLWIPILRIPFIGYFFLLKLPQTFKAWLVISPLLALLIFAVRAAFYGTDKWLERLTQGRR